MILAYGVINNLHNKVNIPLSTFILGNFLREFMEKSYLSLRHPLLRQTIPKVICFALICLLSDKTI